MTSRQIFERWAIRKQLRIDTIYEPSRNGQKMKYVDALTSLCWLAWQARGRIK